jgi:peptidyl-tRNA hydrolase, PTH1 family
MPQGANLMVPQSGPHRTEGLYQQPHFHFDSAESEASLSATSRPATPISRAEARKVRKAEKEARKSKQETHEHSDDEVVQSEDQRPQENPAQKSSPAATSSINEAESEEYDSEGNPLTTLSKSARKKAAKIAAKAQARALKEALNASPSQSQSSSRAHTPSPAPNSRLSAGMPASFRPLLIASIGNPPPTYLHTLHSAGHTVLRAIQENALALTGTPFRSFQKEIDYGKGLVSFPQPRPTLGENTNWTLWQSPSYMNVSGSSLLAAYREWSKYTADGRLVILHDELETAFGSIKLKRGGSARGHNGLKSVAASLKDVEVWKIGVGIGRPESRKPDDVADYVLRKMTAKERVRIEECVNGAVDLLRSIERS